MDKEVIQNYCRVGIDGLQSFLFWVTENKIDNITEFNLNINIEGPKPKEFFDSVDDFYRLITIPNKASWVLKIKTLRAEHVFFLHDGDYLIVMFDNFFVMKKEQFNEIFGGKNG